MSYPSGSCVLIILGNLNFSSHHASEHTPVRRGENIGCEEMSAPQCSRHATSHDVLSKADGHVRIEGVCRHWAGESTTCGLKFWNQPQRSEFSTPHFDREGLRSASRSVPGLFTLVHWNTGFGKTEKYTDLAFHNNHKVTRLGSMGPEFLYVQVFNSVFLSAYVAPPSSTAWSPPPYLTPCNSSLPLCSIHHGWLERSKGTPEGGVSIRQIDACPPGPVRVSWLV